MLSLPSAIIRLEVAHRRIRPFAIGLVHGQDVCAFEDPRLDGLHLVAHAGRHHDERRRGRTRNLELVLPHAHRLDEDDLVTGGVEHADDVARASREPAEVAPRRERADEDAFVGRMARHPRCGRRGSPRPMYGLVGSTAMAPTRIPRPR